MANIKCKYTKLFCSHSYCENKGKFDCMAEYEKPDCLYYGQTKHEFKDGCWHENDCCINLEEKPCMFEKNVKSYSLDEIGLQVGKNIYYLRNHFGMFQEKWFIDSAIDYLEIDGEVIIGKAK